MKKLIVAVIAAALAIAPVVAEGTTPAAGSYGITAAVASNGGKIGGVYHFSDVFAVRPFVGFSTVSTTYADKAYKDYDYSNGSFSIGTDALYELKLADSFLLGLGGRVSFEKYGSTQATAGDDVTVDKSTFSIGALASAQYFLRSNFAVYTDIAIGMSTLKQEYDDGTGVDSEYSFTTTTWGTTSYSLGLAYYIK